MDKVSLEVLRLRKGIQRTAWFSDSREINNLEEKGFEPPMQSSFLILSQLVYVIYSIILIVAKIAITAYNAWIP